MSIDRLMDKKVVVCIYNRILLSDKKECIRVSSNEVQFSSVAQSCLTLCDPMDCSTPGFSIHHQLPELAQTHVH